MSNGIIESADKHGDIFICDDGFVVYWPTGLMYGALTSHALRIIADELDRRNADLTAQVERDLGKKVEGDSQ